MKTFSLATITKEVLYLLIIVFLYVRDIVSVKYVFEVYIGLNLILTISLIFLILAPEINLKKCHYSFGIIKGLVSYGYKLNILSVLNWVYYKISMIMAGKLLNATDVGIYSVSTALAELVFIIANAAATLVFIDNADIERNEEENYINIKLTMLMILITGIGIAIFGKIGITIIYSEEYVSAYIPLLVLIPGNILFGYYKLYGNKLAAAGKPEMLIYITLISLVVIVGMDIVLIPMFGLVGIALASTVAYFVSAYSALYLSKKTFSRTLLQLTIFSSEEKEVIRRRIRKTTSKDSEK